MPPKRSKISAEELKRQRAKRVERQEESYTEVMLRMQELCATHNIAFKRQLLKIVQAWLRGRPIPPRPSRRRARASAAQAAPE